MDKSFFALLVWIKQLGLEIDEFVRLFVSEMDVQNVPEFNSLTSLAWVLSKKLKIKKIFDEYNQEKSVILT